MSGSPAVGREGWAQRRHGRPWRAFAAALGCLVLSALLAPFVAAQEEPANSTVRASVESVDARGEEWTITGIDPDGLPEVSIGEETQAAEAADTATDLVVVIDNDRALSNGNLQLSTAAAAGLAPGTGPIRRVAVVSTATAGAKLERSFTSDPAALERTLEGITADGDAATWDAIATAADLLASSDAPLKRVVAYLAAPDSLSDGSAGAAETQLRLAGARLDVLAVPPGAPVMRLAETVQVSGGSLQRLSSDDEYAAATEAELERIQSQYRLETAAPPGDEAVVALGVRASGADAPTVLGVERAAINIGEFDLAAPENSRGLLSSVTSNPLVGWLAILLVAAAGVGFVWSLLNMVVPDADSLDARLQVYEDGGTAESDEDDAHGVMSVPILQRAVDFTGEMAEKRGFLETIEVSLERASLPLRAAEAMFFVASISVLVGVAAFVLSGSLLVAVMGLGFSLMVPKALLDMKVRARQKKFVAQLPDMLALLAGTLKAGYSITQAFEAVSKEVEEPMGKELRRVVTEHRLGRSLEDALDATAERMGSDDFAWTVMAIKIQREVGGNLAELLLTVADTMTQRERLRRDVNSLTAEGRVSAFILGLLPPGLGVVMYVMNRDYISSLFTPGLGYFMIGAALVAMVVGFVWMKKIITIEV
ncbi:MAG: type II secretion system F family protein [Microthrixaceae bacterium]|nr:type II secretion system F family protein [Microthrixaceae bacterium]